MTLRGLSHVDAHILTSQDPDIVATWFPHYPVRLFRRLVNYRLNQQMYDAFEHPAIKWVAAKTFAAADLLETGRNALQIRRIIRSQRIDLIHVNNGFLPYEVTIAAKWTGVPCIVHARGFQDEPVSRNWAPHVAAVIAVSNAVAKSIQSTPIPFDKVCTIYDPVDVDLVQRSSSARQRIRADWKIGDDDIAVGIFGRVIPWKGQLEFATAVVAAMRSNPRIKAMIIGDESDGNATYFDGIRAFVAAEKMENRFLMVGYQKDVEEYYAAVDIVVHASISPEPFGMVVPEAMAAGRPIIASDAGGPHEVVGHGIDGLLFPPGDVRELERAILTLADDDSLRARMGEAGKHKASIRFGIDENAAQVAALYERLLTTHSDQTLVTAVSSL